MIEQTLSEFLNGRSIWSRVRASGHCPIPETSYINDAVIDALLVEGFGQRIMWGVHTNTPLDTLGFNIAIKMMSKWTDLLKVNSEGLHFGDVKITSKKDTSSHDGNKSTDSVSKTSAYNEEGLVDDSGNSLTDKDSWKDESTSETKVENNSLSELERGLQLRASYNIIDTVVKDIADYLTLSTY